MHEPKSLFTISKASKYLGVSKDTLRRWEKKKILKPFRSPTGWRYYNKSQLDYVYSKKPDFNSVIDSKTDINMPTTSAKEPVNTKVNTKHIESNKDHKLKKTASNSNLILYLFVFILFITLTIILFYVYQAYLI